MDTFDSSYRAADLTPSDRKRRVAAKLQLEKQNVEWLKAKMVESEQLTTGMVSILNSFEERVGRLEETILPVYQETAGLQKRQENIDKTLLALDHVIGFYNVSNKAEKVVREGPNGNNLNAFLEAMIALKGALEYFVNNNPASNELENVRSLYTIGESALSQEFRELLSKHSKPVAAIDILNAVGTSDSVSGDSDEEFSSIRHFPESVHSNMVRIAEWLQVNDREEYMNVYATVRANIMKKSLDQLRDYQRTASGASFGRTSPQMSRNFASPGAASFERTSPQVGRNFATPGAASSTFQENKTPSPNVRKVSFHNMQKVLTRKVSSVSLGRLAALEDENISEVEVDLFMATLSGLQKLLASEQTLMVGIIPRQFRRKFFEIISRESLDMVIKEGGIITAKVKKSISDNDLARILTLFYLLRHLTVIKPSMAQTLEGCNASVLAKYHSLLDGLQVCGTAAMDGLVESIRMDGSTKEKMPADGTVFHLTSNVLLHLEQLLQYVDTVADILKQDAAYAQTLRHLPKRVHSKDKPRAMLGIYVKKVLAQLNLTLTNKSEAYSDQFLKAIFRLNNYVYIEGSLLRSGLLDVVRLSGPWETYDDLVAEQKELYKQSWDKVLGYIWPKEEVPPHILQNATVDRKKGKASGKLPDKYCKIIKEKFSGFNKEVEEISSTQKHYSIPDVELRESVKRDNKEHILPKYNAFMEKFANVNFTKNTDKYIKYSPAQVSGLIDSLFDVAA